MAKVLVAPDTTATRIYTRYATVQEDERAYLGASQLGAACVRATWYGFRWAVAPEEHTPRMIRLFATGKREEARVVDDLLAGGLYVIAQQQGFTTLGGHFQGHIDGIIGGLPEGPKTPHVLEIKTHNERSFKDLITHGVKASKPQHYAQMQVYMRHLRYSRALYVAVNKNDDHIWCERVEYAPKVADALDKRAITIVTTSIAPAKLHEDPSKSIAYVCGWCPAKGVCHDGELPRRNCRTCLSSTPLTDGPGILDEPGRWRCEHHNKALTIAEQRAGCPDHRFLPALIDGTQTDADPQKRTVTYRLRLSGLNWTDGIDA